MMRSSRWISCALVLLYCTATMAIPTPAPCPTAVGIKNGVYADWLPIYAETGENATPADMKKFRAVVEVFEKARWDPTYKPSGRCYYDGKAAIIGRIIFARPAWSPSADPLWHWVGKNTAECTYSNPENCKFLV